MKPGPIIVWIAALACLARAVLADDGADLHRRAVAEIEKLGARVIVKTLESGEKLAEVNILGPRFRREWSGGNEGLRHLGGLAHLRKLRIRGVPQISDRGMAHLRALRGLRLLRLRHTGVTDAGLNHIEELANLEFLGLSSAGFTDGALERIGGLERLTSLRLDGARITDKGIERLKKSGVLGRLEFLSVSDTGVSDSGLAELGGLVRLRRLFLGGTPITDAGLSHLRGLKIESLELSRTAVTDKSVPDLKALTGLQTLFLKSAQVTYEGYAELRRALPECRIAWERAAPLRVGDPPPEISIDRLLQVPESAAASWKSLRGKVVVLEFWATWCAPCVRAIPHMNALSSAFKSRGVQFIAITSEDQSVVERFLEKRPIEAWIGLDPDRSMFTSFGVRNIPYTIVVGKAGSVRAVTSPGGLTEKVLNRFLAEPMPGGWAPWRASGSGS